MCRVTGSNRLEFWFNFRTAELPRVLESGRESLIKQHKPLRGVIITNKQVEKDEGGGKLRW